MLEFLLGSVILLSLGIVFYVTRSKNVQDELKQHIQAAEVIVSTEIKDDIKKVETLVEAHKEEVQTAIKEVAQVATEVAAVVETVKKAAKPKTSKPKAEKVTAPKAKKTTVKGTEKPK